TEHGLAADPGELERGVSTSGPARDRDGRGAVPRLPRRLELRHDLPLAPALGVEDLVDQLVQARAVTVVEADREGREVGRLAGGSGAHGSRTVAARGVVTIRPPPGPG